MKLAIDCRMSGKSGIGTFLDSILPYIVQNFETVLLLKGKDGLKNEESLKKGHVKIVDCPVTPFSITDYLFFPKSTAKEINSCDAFFSPYCNIPSGIKTPIFTTIHDVVFLDIKLSGCIGTLARKLCYKYATIRSKEIFTVSQFSKERIIKHLHVKKTITVVHNGISTYIESNAEMLKGKRESKNKEDSIIFIGNIKKHKGLSTLLNAFTSFHKRTGAKLIIVGSNENFRTKDSSTEGLLTQAENGIRFTGHISDEQLFSLLCNSKILVQPSLYEGFGIPPLEALFCGTKVLVSDIQVFKEIYGTLPVTFFKAGDSEDLERQLERVWNDNCPIQEVHIPYSYKKTAEAVSERIKMFCSVTNNR